ncbi:putative bifunctional diguanylate cyclase/phosphodiesterase [Actinoplanes sp. CA-030573]|uniref:putative bifunctional diguanylate cyclase/phosphodiesterase n=1 Tax=Actinoplanes sp. CA-030573 TaxID=3239898 RepID=UPI003D8F6CC2
MDPTARRRVSVMVALLVAIASVLWVFAVRLPGYRPSHFMTWIVVAVLSAAAERFVVHIQLRREAQAVSLSEIPLVLGLFLATPVDFGVGRTLGMLAACVIWRRSSPLKTIFNTVQVAVESAVALLVFDGLLAGVGDGTPARWLAAFAATAAVGAVSALSITAVVALADGALHAGDLLREPARGAVTSAAAAIGGLIAVILVEQSWWNGLLVLSALTGLMIVYRAYAGLAERHLSLERLHQFSQAVGAGPEVNEVLHTILSQATQVLHAARAEVLFLPGTTDAEAVRIGVGPQGELVRTAATLDGPWAQAVNSGEPVLIARTGHDGIVVPLRGDAGLIGALHVSDRLGDVRTFDENDVRLLETVANHAAVALGRGQLVHRLEHEAAHDALTGLPNRDSLRRRIGELLAADAGVAVMLMNLDDFNRVNDALGHHHGDAVLRHVARVLREATPAEGMVARLGGDEFAIVLAQVRDAREAVEIGDRLRAAIRTPVTVDGVRLEASASLGVAVAPEHGHDEAHLLRHADMAMHRAKKTHRGVSVFDPGGGAPESAAQLTLAADLRAALGEGQLRLYVQPKAGALSGEVLGVEALVRWVHPSQGMIMPDQFIPIAERTGLIQAVTAEVLDAAITAAAGWAASGTPIGIAVNLSPRSLLGSDLEGQVAALLAAHRVDPGLLTLELTESSMMTDPDRVAALMADLHRRGVRLSIDDFGTGYSSLSTLRGLPLDEVKVDKSFVMGMADNADDETIVRTVVDLGRNLGLDVVAEGVESEQAWQTLRRMGCTHVQGYHLSRPMPVGEFPGWLARYRRTRAAGTPEAA